MIEYLPDAVKQGLERARRDARKARGRLSVQDGDQVYRILRFWEGGFSVDSTVSDKLRGHVDIYDGPRHLYKCLIVSSEIENEERIYEFKWLTNVADRPAADFEKAEFVPKALLE